jgi:hypothetical protein
LAAIPKAPVLPQPALSLPETPPKSLTGQLASCVLATPKILSIIGSALEWCRKFKDKPTPEHPMHRKEGLNDILGTFTTDPSNNPFAERKTDLAQMCHEGGVGTINLLLKAAEGHPTMKPVWEQTYFYVQHLPAVSQTSL